MTVTSYELPRADALGTDAEWLIPGTDVNDDLQLHVRFLGFGSSYQAEHRNQAHPNGDPVPRGKCQSCRWYEVRIFREIDASNGNERRFLTHHTGASAVPGEEMRYRYRLTVSAHAVVEDLTVRNSEGDKGPETFLAPPAARALAEAAGYDKDLEEAWINRAIP